MVITAIMVMSPHSRQSGTKCCHPTAPLTFLKPGLIMQPLPPTLALTQSSPVGLHQRLHTARWLIHQLQPQAAVAGRYELGQVEEA